MAPTNTPPEGADAAESAVDTSRWMLGGEPPEPQKIPTPAKVDPDVRNADTHTGTDPLGRAIGPRESHLAVKRVRDADGEIVTPSAGRGLSVDQAEARAKRTAEETGTKREAVDRPRADFTPAQVARAHAENRDLDAPKG